MQRHESTATIAAYQADAAAYAAGTATQASAEVDEFADGHEAEVLDPLVDDLGGPYDAVWASACLLHVRRHDLPRAGGSSWFAG